MARNARDLPPLARNRTTGATRRARHHASGENQGDSSMKRLSMAAVLFLIAFAGHAQDESTDSGAGFRVGAAAAFSDYSGDESFPIEDSGLGLQLYAQAQLNKWFAMEVGYYNSGGFEQSIVNPLTRPSTGELEPVELSFSGFNISAIGYLPLFQKSDTDIDLFLKAGVYDYDIDITQTVSNSKLKTSLGHSTGFLVGGGIVLNVSENIGIRASLDWYDIDNADLWAMGIGAEFQF
jgi:opacity protein-like surface antigen